jgi:putative endopeptidase
MRVNLLRKFGAGLVLTALSFSTFAQSKGFDITRMDSTAQACDNFFQFSNGAWDKRTEIPADRSRFGSFDILSDKNRDTLREILDSASNPQNKRTADIQIIGDFYASCMDEAAVEKADASGLKSYFQQIDSIKDANNLQLTIARLHKSGFPALFGFSVSADLKSSAKTLANASQGGLSLPNRNYYTEEDDKSNKIREQFVEHIARMFELIGDAPSAAQANAKTVMQIQTRLAKASKAPRELRDPEKRYNKITLAAAKEIAPNMNWDGYLSERGAKSVTEINVGQPDFFREVNKMLTDVSLAEWQTYLKWMTLNASAPRLSKKFADENFNFYSKTLTGTKEQQPRWKRCINATDNAVGEALGTEFVKKVFTPEQKKRMNEMIDNLLLAFRERVADLDWMTPATKQEAFAKLDSFKRKIGFPDKLRGYEGLKINRNSYFENTVRVAQFEIARNVQDLGKPTDKTRWGYHAPTVNASYSGTNNDITFPAGILQPPFFNFDADDAVNYGGIGAVIGHEITHGFDDQGSKFDAKGNYRMWWTAEDRTKFEGKANCVANQFGNYEVLPGLKMDGGLTLGENIADLGGLTMAYAALQKSFEGKPRPANIDGFTPEQRFFLGWAQVWGAKATPEAVRVQVKGDPHALPQWRVNGPLGNLPIFAEAFQCKTGDKMVRDERCQIW